VAIINGKAAFFEPLMGIMPVNGRPPSIRNIGFSGWVARWDFIEVAVVSTNIINSLFFHDYHFNLKMNYGFFMNVE